MAKELEISPPRHRFSVAILRKILKDVLKASHHKPPSREMLEWLVFMLNQKSGTFAFITKHADSEQQADDVASALRTLSLFFERRRKAFSQLPDDAELAQRERQLYNQFYDFLDTMEKHEFDLDMDTVLTMARIDTWRQIAEGIASCFRVAMAPQVIGESNDGPQARFGAKVIPLITGETPTVGTVGKHLKDRRAGIRRTPRSRRRITGTLVH
jgi:hypothetical protein